MSWSISRGAKRRRARPRASSEKAGAEVRLVQGDVAQDEDCRRLAEAALAAWGRIDILVNNAGTTKFAAHGDLDALDAEDFSRIYAVNVVGAFQMIRACRKALEASGAGRRRQCLFDRRTSRASVRRLPTPRRRARSTP